MREHSSYETCIINSELWPNESLRCWKRKGQIDTQGINVIQTDDWFQYPNSNKYTNLINALKRRYLSYSDLFDILHAWSSNMTETEVLLVSHIHVCLTDKLYREFGSMLTRKQLDLPIPNVQRQFGRQFVSSVTNGRWAPKTTGKITQQILLGYQQIQRVKPKDQLRVRVHILDIPKTVVSYIGYLVQRIGYTDQSIIDNDYWMSLGLTKERLRLKYPETYLALQEQIPPFELVKNFIQHP